MTDNPSPKALAAARAATAGWFLCCDTEALAQQSYNELYQRIALALEDQLEREEWWTATLAAADETNAALRQERDHLEKALANITAESAARLQAYSAVCAERDEGARLRAYDEVMAYAKGCEAATRGPHDYDGTRCKNCGVEYDRVTTPTWCDKYPAAAKMTREAFRSWLPKRNIYLTASEQDVMQRAALRSSRLIAEGETRDIAATALDRARQALEPLRDRFSALGWKEAYDLAEANVAAALDAQPEWARSLTRTRALDEAVIEAAREVAGEHRSDSQYIAALARLRNALAARDEDGQH